MKNRSIRRLALAGVLTAVIMLLTIFASIPMPGGHGYVNLGDAGVLVAAYMLGGFWGGAAAAIASALADLLVGWSVYAPASFLIKGSLALLAHLCFAHVRGKGRSFLLYPAALVVPIGYFLYETVLYQLPAALINLPINIAQCLIGAAVAQGIITGLIKTNALGALGLHATDEGERARLLREPKGGPEVVLIARDTALALRAGDTLSVQGIMARVVALDKNGKQQLSELLPANIPALRHDGKQSAEELAKLAREAVRHDS